MVDTPSLITNLLISALGTNTINSFISNMSDNLLSPNRFQVTINAANVKSTGPNIGQVIGNVAASFGGAALGSVFNTLTGAGNGNGKNGATGSASSQIMMNCASISIPSLNLDTVQDKRYNIGNPMQYVSGRELQNINLGFYESNSHKERQFFSTWIDGIYNKTTRKFSYYDNYVKTITITQFDKNNNKVYTCELSGCFPVHVSELQRSYSVQDTVEIMNVTIAYHELKETFVAGGANPLSAISSGLNLISNVAPLVSPTIRLP